MPAPVSLAIDARLSPREGVAFKRTEDGAMTVDLSTGSCYRLSATGADLWESLQTGQTLGEAIDTLVDRYEIDRPTAEADSLRLCAVLLSSSLLVVEPSGPRR